MSILVTGTEPRIDIEEVPEMDFTSPIALDLWRALEIERKEQRKQNRLVTLVRSLDRGEIKAVVLPSTPPSRPGGFVGTRGS
jgi:hypothetical protein